MYAPAALDAQSHETISGLRTALLFVEKRQGGFSPLRKRKKLGFRNISI